MATLILCTLIYLSISVGWYARRRADYSHLRHSISELAERGSTHGRTVSFLVFLPVGLACLSVGWSVRNSHPAASGLLVAFGAAYALSAFFPCDPGAPFSGSWKNSIHSVVGGVCYAAIAYQLNELTESSMGSYFQVSLWMLGTFLAAYVIGWPRTLIGLLQRLAEASVLIGVVWLLRESPAP